MVNKLKFNNMVISNKKGIQKSLSQTINKLVHKIRKLKSQLEKHPDDAKCKERMRKSMETMEILKKLKSMDVVKKVLLMDTPATSVICNGKSTPEELAVALLSINKVMQGLIKRFKTELQLNESDNDEWKQVLIEPSKRKQKIERTETKRGERSHLKLQKAMGRKRQEWLEANQQNIGSGNISIDTDSNVSTITGGWQMEEIKIENDMKETQIKSSSNNEAESFVPNINHKIKTKKESKNVNTKFLESPKNESRNDITKDTSESLVLDTFFITDTGENYMSTAALKTDNFAEKESSGKDQYIIKVNKYDTKSDDFRNRRPQTRGKNPQDFAHRRQQKKSEWNREKQNKWNNKHEYEAEKITKNSCTDEKNIHPSWAAKQRLKPAITGFQGKKMRFEDNDITEGKSTKQNKSENDSLHPSWAAKQQLKPFITTFQGKKTTFASD